MSIWCTNSSRFTRVPWITQPCVLGQTYSTRHVSSCRVSLKSNQKGVILLTPIPLLLPQAYLLLLQCTEFIVRRDYWWLSPQATYVSPSDTMKASYQGEASRSAPVWFLHILQLMCVMFSTISSSSGGQPEARQVMVWGSPGHLWPTTWKKISHTWYWDIYLATYSFWKEHNRLCRVTPIELW